MTRMIIIMKLNHLIASIWEIAVSYEKALDRVPICRCDIPVAVVTGLDTRSYNVGSLCEQPIRTCISVGMRFLSSIISYKILYDPIRSYGKNHFVHSTKVMAFIKFVFVAW